MHEAGRFQELLSKMQNVIYSGKKRSFKNLKKFPAPCVQLLDLRMSLKLCV